MPDFNHIEHIRELIAKHLRNELSENERLELEEWNRLYPSTEQFIEDLRNDDQVLQKIAQWNTVLDSKEITREKVRERFVGERRRMKKGKVLFLRSWLKYAVVAAAIIVFVTLIAYWFIERNSKTRLVNTNNTIKPSPADLLPGGNKAILTLSNGQSIVLDNAAKGNLAQQGNTQIIKTNDGELSYNASSGNGGGVYYNTVSTPRGGQYKLLLPDGTKVWMNAASSLRFATAFNGKERLVELTGEAYFEVVKNANMPFIVKLNNDVRVQVFGTHFNIMAYDDEKEMKTTLLEGSVKVTRGVKAALLQPGQQAVLNAEGSDINIDKNTNVDEAVAWKDGRFEFNHADLRTVMRQISRWYDVDISYEGDIPAKNFSGEMSRNLKASEVLSVIEFAGVHFNINGKKIIVRP